VAGDLEGWQHGGMPEHCTRALVLRSFDYAESDRIVHLYTEALGRVSAIAKGARRSRRRFPGGLELLSVSDVRIVASPRASLLRLESARLVQSYEGLVTDLRRFAVGCQLAEMLDRFTADGDPNPRLFQFAVGVLGVLRDDEPDPLFRVLVVAKTLAWFGYEPRLERCGSCGRALLQGCPASFDPRQGGALCESCRSPADPGVDPRVLKALATGIRSPLRSRHALGFDAASVRAAGRMVELFLHFHIGADLRSSRFLQQIERFAQLDAAGCPEDTRPGTSAPSRARAEAGSSRDRGFDRDRVYRDEVSSDKVSREEGWLAAEPCEVEFSETE
jgi:DNA repair protein RecO (recombination protein O)